MHPRSTPLPTPLNPDMETLDSLDEVGGGTARPINVFIGHNLGHRVFTMSVPFMDFYELSDVANNPDAGEIAQRRLDTNHSRKLAIYMLKGLISAAKLRREAKGEPVSETFDLLLHEMGSQPYFSLQPIVCTIRSVQAGGADLAGKRLMTPEGETAAFKVFLEQKHTLWVIDGQHRRDAANSVVEFLKHVRNSAKYPAKSSSLFPRKGHEVSPEEMVIWNEVYVAMRSYATISVEVALGLTVEEERQLFHDLNQLGKKVDRSLALQFDSSNAITLFIKNDLVGGGMVNIVERDAKTWADDTGAFTLKDIVAVTAQAFHNKSNVTGATPAMIEPRQEVVSGMWETINSLPHFGDERAKEKTILGQPVVLKAIAKITFDLNFNRRRPDNAESQYAQFLSKLPSMDFSHSNPVWRWYQLSDGERIEAGLSGLENYLPDDEGANRDLGAYQEGVMRFGAKHNDIFPIIADMIRWQVGLDSRQAAA